MKYAADFRQIAREALSGKWMIAVLVGLVASLLGGAGADGPELKLDIADPPPSVVRWTPIHRSLSAVRGPCRPGTG